MVCIYCGYETSVKNSRHNKRANTVWRRRQCISCTATVTTHEEVDLSTSLHVLSDDLAHTTPFSRDKLFISIYKSCGHRKSALNDATALTATVIGQLTTEVSSAQVNRSEIQLISLKVLENFDTVAAVQYAAYHKA